MNRRNFLATAAACGIGNAQTTAIPIIDTHIHLYDPARPQGVPWPPKGGAVPYVPTLPDGYRKLTKQYGVVGAIEVECSPWLEDNQWVLDVSAKDTVMVGVVGDLEPGKPDFRKHLERFHKNPLFLGIRFGYLWGRSLAEVLPKPSFLADMKALAAAGLELDTVGPPQLLGEVVRLTDQVPNLRVVIDHLAQQKPPTEAGPKAAYRAAMRELGKRPQVYVKVSEVLRQEGGKVAYDVGFYKDRLDEYWEVFGQDRLIYGSDWPNSETVGKYAQVLNVVKEYFKTKGRVAEEKFFWRNSVAAYRWKKRDASQPQGV